MEPQLDLPENLSGRDLLGDFRGKLPIVHLSPDRRGLIPAPDRLQLTNEGIKLPLHLNHIFDSAQPSSPTRSRNREPLR
jgi:hypothetical protein